MKKTKTTLSVDEQAIKRFRKIAERYGLVSLTGTLAGQGNQNQLVEAIADGRFLVVENPAYEATQ